MDEDPPPKDVISRREQLLRLAALAPATWLAGNEAARAAAGQPGQEGSAANRTIQLPHPGSIARPLEAYLQDRPISVKDFGAKGDYNPDNQTGTDDTNAIQAAFDSMAARHRGSPNVLFFPPGYYKISSAINIPEYFSFNIVEGNGAALFYRGPRDNEAALFRVSKNFFINNEFRNFQLHCEDLCGYGIYAAGETNLSAIKNTLWHYIHIYHPTNWAVRWGDFSASGRDMDGSNTSFYFVTTHLKSGQRGIVIDAPNAFNIGFFNLFLGNWGDGSRPSRFMQFKNGSGFYLYDIYTGKVADGDYAIEINDGNLMIAGWNTEGGELLLAHGFQGERRNIHIANVMVNDSTPSREPTYAIYAPAGEITLESATIGKSNIHPRKIYSGDRLCATNVYLGSNEDGSVIGGYVLDHPDRCIIEGKALLDVRTMNGNPQFDLWRGGGPDDLPWGYEKSEIGACTVTRDETPANLLNGPFVAKLAIAAGGLARGMCDGLVARTPVSFLQAGTRNLVAVVRGKAAGLRGTSGVSVRLRFLDKSGNPVDSGGGTAVTPDGEGHFLAFVTGRPADRSAVSVEVGVGLGVAGASGTLFVQTVHLLRYDPYTVNGGENWRVIVDAWTKYPAQTNPIEEYAKCGVTAHYRRGELVRQWLGSAVPASGSHVRGDMIWNDDPAAGNPPGWLCVSGGTPGSWKAMADLGR